MNKGSAGAKQERQEKKRLREKSQREKGRRGEDLNTCFHRDMSRAPAKPVLSLFLFSCAFFSVSLIYRQQSSSFFSFTEIIIIFCFSLFKKKKSNRLFFPSHRAVHHSFVQLVPSLHNRGRERKNGVDGVCCENDTPLRTIGSEELKNGEGGSLNDLTC